MRFNILYHTLPPNSARQSHWDFLVEAGETLWTWALEQEPHTATQAAQRLADHRRLYLDYEGPLSDNRGEVRRWDTGTCEIEHESSEKLVYCLHGAKLQGRLSLTFTNPANNVWQWEFVKEEQ